MIKKLTDFKLKILKLSIVIIEKIKYIYKINVSTIIVYGFDTFVYKSEINHKTMRPFLVALTLR